MECSIEALNLRPSANEWACILRCYFVVVAASWCCCCCCCCFSLSLLLLLLLLLSGFAVVLIVVVAIAVLAAAIALPTAAAPAVPNASATSTAATAVVKHAEACDSPLFGLLSATSRQLYPLVRGVVVARVVLTRPRAVAGLVGEDVAHAHGRAAVGGVVL